MKKINVRRITAAVVTVLAACILFTLFSGKINVRADGEGAAEGELLHYTIFGSLDGFDIIVSGEHVYDGQTLAVGTRFEVEEGCSITKIRKYFGKEEHGTFVAAIWDGDTGELIKQYDWTLESGKDAWEELVLPEPIEIEPQHPYVVEVQNTKESPYYVYTRGYFDDVTIEFFDISGGNSVFSERPGDMSTNAMGGNANFLVDVEVEYFKPAETPTPEATEAPTPTPAPEATEAPKETEMPTGDLEPEKKGCGGIAESFVAIMALAGAGFFLIRKKH